MKLTLTQTRAETPEVTTFILEPEAPLSWIPGQFLHYRLPHPEVDDRGVERYFTIASAPYEGHVQITTRFTDERGSSFKQALRRLQVGGMIEAEGPEGEFTLTEPTGEYVFIAGGIGITPFRAILLDLAQRGVPHRVKLLYANRNAEIIFKDELDRLAAKNPDLELRYLIDPDRINEARLRAEVPELSRPVFYLSGPKPMVNAMQELLLGLDVSPEQIKRDAFPGYS